MLIKFLLFLIGSFVLNSANVSIETKIDKSVINIGDYINYSIKINYPDGIKIIPPKPGANLGNFDIKDFNVIDTKDKKSGLNQKIFVYKITTYFLGEFEIPSVEIGYTDENNNTGILKTEPLIIKVVPVERKPTDKDDIRDLKPQIYLKNLIWIYIIGAVILSILAYFLAKKYLIPFIQKKPSEVLNSELKLPEDVLALNKIDALLNKNYIENGEIKQFYFELSEIIREYLGKRYNISTLERTSSEIMKDLRKLIYEKETISKIEDFFYETDMVKFAKYIPTKSELNNIVPLSKEIIEKTKRVITPYEISQS